MKVIHLIIRSIANIAVLAISILLFSCKSDPVSNDQSSLTITGQVVDEQGQPVSSAGVHYIFDMEPMSQLPKANKICPSTTIGFQIPKPGHVSLKIYRWYTNELVATLADTTLSAGYFNFVFDAGKMTNGVYVYRLLYDTVLTERKMLLMILDYNALANTTPLVQTDGNGRFTLTYEQLGFNIPFQMTSSSGTVDTVYISPAISLVLVKSGYQTLVVPMTIDLSRETIKTFILRK